MHGNEETLIENAAEATEELTDKYLEGADLSVSEIKEGIRAENFGKSAHTCFLWFCLQKQRCASNLRWCD